MRRPFCLPLFPSAVALVVVAFGCGGGGSDGGDGGTLPPELSGFNGTFRGELVSTGEEGDTWRDTISMSVTSQSPLSGTFFRGSDGAIGTIAGDVSDDFSTFSGTSDGDCSASFSGSMSLGADRTLSIDLEGTDCTGGFTSSGTLNEVGCIDIGGTYFVEESATVICSAQGESETDTQSGAGTLELVQDQCRVSYQVPGVSVTRQGELRGNTLNLSGPLAIATGGVSFSSNEFSASVAISDEYRYGFNGSGSARGRVEGVDFSCTAETRGTLRRCFDVAVAVLRGGPIGDFRTGDSLDGIRTAAIEVDPRRVVARGFRAGLDQLANAPEWLQNVNEGCERPARAVLVGHSLGGDAVRRASLANLCSRITIDPINPVPVALSQFNQRELFYSPETFDGRFLNVLASSTPNPLVLLGHQISGVLQIEEENTDHFTVVQRVLDQGYVQTEVQACL